ncbi:MAG: hypothetical protein MJ193_04420, partial [Clostridia bacterium]|nr:hypothetical protein [Clostridia bacterium]
MPKFVDPNEEIEFLESEIIDDDDDDDIPVGELVIHQPSTGDKKINITANQMETQSVSSALNDDFAIVETPEKAEEIDEEPEEKPQPKSVNEENIWGVAKINV